MKLNIKREINAQKDYYITSFDSDSGLYVRSNILTVNNKDTEVEVFMSPKYPELIDIGIMGSCDHGKLGLCVKAGVECYQSGLSVSKPNMSINNYKRIIDEITNKGVYQVALGGRGDPNKHEYFKELLEYTRRHNIVPNYTTSGLDLRDDEVEITAQFVGAVAVSWYRSEYTIRAIQKFLKAKIITNIHYVLSTDTIDEAINILKGDILLPTNINAIIFLLHKPIGLGSESKVLKITDSRVVDFFELVDNWKGPFQIGFDSCSVPGLLNLTYNVDERSIDTCEAARFSMYISSDMIAVPCSFDQVHKYGVDLNSHTISEAWMSTSFNEIRSKFSTACSSQTCRLNCLGGCPLMNSITLCSKERA